MKLIYKIMGMCLVISVFAGIAVFSSIKGIYLLRNDFLNITEKTLPLVETLEDLRFAGLRIVASTNEFVLILNESRYETQKTTSETMKESEISLITNAFKSYNKAFNKYESYILRNSSEDKTLLEKIRAAGQRLIKQSKDIMELKESGKEGAEVLELKEEFEEVETVFLNVLSSGLEHESKKLAKRKEEALLTAETSIDTIIFITVSAFFLSLACSILISIFITRPVERLKLAAIKIGQGELDIHVDVRSNDEIGKLAKTFNKMAGDLKTGQNNLISITEKLKHSNNDLNEFLFIASHDLQEPLRKIMVFGDRLSDLYSEALGERGHAYIERMQKASGRMQVLINDLLTFAKININKQAFVTVDLGNIAKEACANLKAGIEQSGGRLIIEKLPSLDADPEQIQQLFHNIIDNAIKFRKKNENPVVTVRSEYVPAAKNCMDSNEAYEITIEDNGIGFEEKYAERIFRVFQKLHSKDEYPGSGIGLSVCKKIVERHSGTIYAKSAPGQGAKFVVTLPVTQSNGTSEQT